MGADIHVYLEKRNNEGKWTPLNLYIDGDNGEKEFVNFYNGRFYLLFGQLAGVRATIEPFVYPRGLPDDLSDFVKSEYDKGNDTLSNGETVNFYHTPFWYDYVELSLYAKTKEAVIEDWEDDPVNPVADFVNDASRVLDFYGIWDPNPGEIRIVGWFDS